MPTEASLVRALFRLAASSLLFTAFAAAQSPDLQADKVFTMKNLINGQGLNEIATVFRQVSGAQQVMVDESSNSVHVWGTVDQIAMAQWLQTVLDEPVSAFSTRDRSLEHPSPTNPDDIAIVEYLPSSFTPQTLQEAITTLRQVAEINALFQITEERTIALRGNPAQIAMANWLVDEIKQLPGWNAPRGSSFSMHQYRAAGSSADDVTAVFQLAYIRNPQAVQETVSAVRKGAAIHRMFSPRGAIVVRGTAAQIAQAQSIIASRDVPPPPAPVRSPAR